MRKSFAAARKSPNVHIDRLRNVPHILFLVLLRIS
jgi:hypothetical protein